MQELRWCRIWLWWVEDGVEGSSCAGRLPPFERCLLSHYGLCDKAELCSPTSSSPGLWCSALQHIAQHFILSSFSDPWPPWYETRKHAQSTAAFTFAPLKMQDRLPPAPPQTPALKTHGSPACHVSITDTGNRPASMCFSSSAVH